MHSIAMHAHVKREHTVACKQLGSGTFKHVRVLHVNCGADLHRYKHVSYMSYTQDAYMHAAADTMCVTAWNFNECASATCGETLDKCL